MNIYVYIHSYVLTYIDIYVLNHINQSGTRQALTCKGNLVHGAL